MDKVQKHRIVLGDFNELSFSTDKLTVHKGNPTRLTNFNNFSNDNSLMDLGCSGNPFT